jgi:hypothetical protein
MNHKSLDTLVDDIYKAISPLSKGKPIKLSKKDLKEFGNDMTLALESWASPIERDTTNKNTLRMSNIGRKNKQLWYDLNFKKEEKELPPSLFIKFLYGHLLEVLLLFFVKLSKHKVESLQKEVSVSGIKGHMDCKIDGEVVDIKSASGFAFKKFKDGTLAESDAFGYLSQLAGYEAAEKTNDGGFLVINKETGELTFFKPEDLDKPNIKNRIREVKRIVKRKTPPDFCYPTIPEGKSGNMKLPRECTYCPYKYECHKSSNDGKGLRVFNYAKGPTYFTKIINEPKVEEVL